LKAWFIFYVTLILPSFLFSKDSDDLTNNILKTIYRKPYIAISSTDSLNNCNNATDPRYIYIVRETALNRPSSTGSEFQMFILQSVWNRGIIQLGIFPDCNIIVLRRNENSFWTSWFKVSLVSAT
jgi:hypothetical protein